MDRDIHMRIADAMINLHRKNLKVVAIYVGQYDMREIQRDGDNYYPRVPLDKLHPDQYRGVPIFTVLEDRHLYVAGATP